MMIKVRSDIRIRKSWTIRLTAVLQCRGHNRLGPVGNFAQLDRCDDLAAVEVQELHGRRPLAGCRVGIKAVVEDLQFSQARQKVNEVPAAGIKAFPDLLDGDVVAAVADSCRHPGDVPFRAVEPDVPEADRKAGFDRLIQGRRDGVATECSFEPILMRLADRGLQPSQAFGPSLAVGHAFRDIGVFLADTARGFVRIEVIATCLAEEGTGDAALAGAIGTGKHPDAGRRFTHPCVRPPPPCLDRQRSP